MRPHRTLKIQRFASSDSSSSECEYQAGREYQRLAEQAGRGVKSGSFGAAGAVRHTVFGVPDTVLVAARRLRVLDGKIVLAFGTIGIVTLRAVIEGLGPKKIALRFGAATQRGCDWYARLLRETVAELSILTGVASRPASAWRPLTAWAGSAVVQAATQEGAG
jgi:hypothetical protein